MSEKMNQNMRTAFMFVGGLLFIAIGKTAIDIEGVPSTINMYERCNSNKNLAIKIVKEECLQIENFEKHCDFMYEFSKNNLDNATVIEYCKRASNHIKNVTKYFNAVNKCIPLFTSLGFKKSCEITFYDQILIDRKDIYGVGFHLSVFLYNLGAYGILCGIIGFIVIGYNP